MDKDELEALLEQAAKSLNEHTLTAEDIERLRNFKDTPENKARQKAGLKEMFAESQAMDRKIARAAREKRAAPRTLSGVPGQKRSG